MLDSSQETYETLRTKSLLFGEQRSTIAGKVCLSEYVLDVCDDGRRNYMYMKAVL